MLTHLFAIQALCVEHHLSPCIISVVLQLILTDIQAPHQPSPMLLAYYVCWLMHYHTSEGFPQKFPVGYVYTVQKLCFLELSLIRILTM